MLYRNIAVITDNSTESVEISARAILDGCLSLPNVQCDYVKMNQNLNDTNKDILYRNIVLVTSVHCGHLTNDFRLFLENMDVRFLNDTEINLFCLDSTTCKCCDNISNIIDAVRKWCQNKNYSLKHFININKQQNNVNENYVNIAFTFGQLAATQ